MAHQNATGFLCSEFRVEVCIAVASTHALTASRCVAFSIVLSMQLRKAFVCSSSCTPSPIHCQALQCRHVARTMQLSGVRGGQRTGHGGGHGRREVRWLPSHPAVGTFRVAVSRPWPAASVAHCYPCWSCYWCFGRLFDVVSDSGTDEEKERDIDSYGVMLLVVMSASAACQVGMVRQCVLDRVATAPSLLFRPLVPSSSIPSSRLSPPLLRSCSPSHPLSLLVVSALSFSCSPRQSGHSFHHCRADVLAQDLPSSTKPALSRRGSTSGGSGQPGARRPRRRWARRFQHCCRVDASRG